MDKFAGNTSEPDYNANNPLPAAAALAAIGGIAGLGGSLLSKKQRKHKLRNTLLGATALPAAFLAANKWGPEAVKSKLNDFSGNVYDQYANYVAKYLPAASKYVGPKNINSDLDVQKSYNDSLAANRRKQDAASKLDKYETQTPFKSEAEPTAPTYKGVTDADVRKAEGERTSAHNKFKAVSDEVSKKKQRNSGIYNKLESQQKSTQNYRNSASMQQYETPQDLKEYNDLLTQIKTLDSGKVEATIKGLDKDYRAGRLTPEVAQNYEDSQKYLGSILESIENTEGQIKDQTENREAISEQLKKSQGFLANYNEAQKKFDQEALEKAKRLEVVNHLLGDDKLIYDEIDPETSATIAQYERMARLAKSRSSEDQENLANLISAGRDDAFDKANRILSQTTELLNNDYSQKSRDQKAEEVVNDLVNKYTPVAKRLRDEEIVRRGRQHQNIKDVPSIEAMLKEYRNTEEVQKAVKAELAKFDKDREQIEKSLPGLRAQRLAAAKNYALNQEKNLLPTLKGSLQKAFDDKKRAYQDEQFQLQHYVKPQVPALEKINNNIGIYEQRLKEIDDAIAKYNKELELYRSDLANVYNGQEWFTPILDDYVAKNIDPLRQQQKNIEDRQRMLQEQAKLDYDNAVSSMDFTLSDLATRLQQLREEDASLDEYLGEAENDFNEKDRHLLELQRRNKEDKKTFEQQQRDYQKNLADVRKRNAENWNKWDARRRELEADVNTEDENAVRSDEEYKQLKKSKQTRSQKLQNRALAATGGSAGALILLSALNKLRKRRKQKISPEEYINYLEEEGLA